MRTTTILFVLMVFLPSSFAQEEKEKEEAKIRQDRAQIRKSLRQMVRVDEKKRRARLSLVIEAGISGLDPKAKPPQPGQMAPDFEVTPLKFYGFQIQQSEGKEEPAAALYMPVRLSDFRGKKPVVLIFGSYT